MNIGQEVSDKLSVFYKDFLENNHDTYMKYNRWRFFIVSDDNQLYHESSSSTCLVWARHLAY